MALSFIFSTSDSFEDFTQVDLHFAPSAIFTHVLESKSFKPEEKKGFIYNQSNVRTTVYQFGMIEQMMSAFKIDPKNKVLLIKHDFNMDYQPADDQVISLIKTELSELSNFDGLVLSSNLVEGFKKIFPV